MSVHEKTDRSIVNSDMKDSGIYWIGKIPMSWDRTSLLNCLRMSITDGPHETPIYQNEGIPFISVDSLNDSNKVDLSVVKRFISEDDYVRYSKKTVLEYGDILYTKAATIGKTAIVGNEKIMVWSPIAIIKPDCSRIDTLYLYHMLSCASFSDYVKTLGSFNTQANVGMRELEKAIIPVPPLNVQKRIGKEINDSITKLDFLINYQKEAINQLFDLKQSIISEVVTKGLDSSATLKDSGVDWIGMIPESWHTSRLKYVSRERGEVLSEKTEPEMKIAYVEISNVSQSKGIHSVQHLSFKDSPSRARKLTRPNDIIISTVRTYLKAIAPITEEGLVVSTGFLVLVPTAISSRYLKYSILNDRFISNIIRDSYGVSYPAITSDTIMNFEITVPPEDEQELISDYLDKKIAILDSNISLIEDCISHLTEMKQSLIYEYVTGKKNVDSEESL